LVQFKHGLKLFRNLRQGRVSQFHFGSIQTPARGGFILFTEDGKVSIPLWFNSNIPVATAAGAYVLQESQFHFGSIQTNLKGNFCKLPFKVCLNSTLVQFKQKKYDIDVEGLIESRLNSTLVQFKRSTKGKSLIKN